MTYEELKAAYEAAVQKCFELENEIDELKKSNEDMICRSRKQSAGMTDMI